LRGGTLATAAANGRVALNAAGFTGRIVGLQTGNVLTLVGDYTKRPND